MRKVCIHNILGSDTESLKYGSDTERLVMVMVNI